MKNLTQQTQSFNLLHIIRVWVQIRLHMLAIKEISWRVNVSTDHKQLCSNMSLGSRLQKYTNYSQPLPMFLGSQLLSLDGPLCDDSVGMWNTTRLHTVWKLCILEGQIPLVVVNVPKKEMMWHAFIEESI